MQALRKRHRGMIAGPGLRGLPPALPLRLPLLLLLPLLLAPPLLQAQVRAHPFPPALETERIPERGLRAPGLRSGPRAPLVPAPRTGYGAVLERPVESTAQPLALGWLAFYRRVVSPVNGSNSDLAPVPSLYSVQAIKRYGVLLGMVLTAERLIHEPSVIPTAPRFVEDGRVFFYDPLDWNVHWLPDWLR